MTLDPEHLITIGIYGSAGFVLVALAGVAWHHLVPARPTQGGRSAAASGQKRRPAPPTIADRQTRAQELARLKARGDIAGYLNGPVADLLSDLDRLLTVPGSGASHVGSPKALSESLHMIGQRAKGVFAGWDQIVDKHRALPIVRATNWNAPSSLDYAIATVIDNLHEVADDDDAPPLVDLPASARLSMSLGEISIWMQQKRSALATLR